MNGIEIIQDKADIVATLSKSRDTDNILLHVRRAILFYEQGVALNDDQFFTDVIYRCNQAFEGCSRTAYRVLSDKTESEVQATKAYKIEKYLVSEQVLNDRVFPLFENYRNSWRNESAHNFALFFTENEGFIAISNVISYAYVLFNQMILKLSAQSSGKANTESPKTVPADISSRSLHDSLVYLISNFFNDNRYESVSMLTKNVNFLDIRVQAGLAAFLKGAMPTATVETEKRVGSFMMFLDILVIRGEEMVAIELKTNSIMSSVNDGTNQLFNMIKLANLQNGILVVYPKDGRRFESVVGTTEFGTDGKRYVVTTISPKQK